MCIESRMCFQRNEHILKLDVVVEPDTPMHVSTKLNFLLLAARYATMPVNLFSVLNIMVQISR